MWRPTICTARTITRAFWGLCYSLEAGSVFVPVLENHYSHSVIQMKPAGKCDSDHFQLPFFRECVQSAYQKSVWGRICGRDFDKDY